MSPRETTHPATTAINTRYDDAPASPGFVLWQVASLWQRSLRGALEEAGLTHAQFVLLASAGWLEAESNARSGAPVTQADIAAHAKTDAVMTSEVLRTLERKGLVRRHAHQLVAHTATSVVGNEARFLQLLHDAAGGFYERCGGSGHRVNLAWFLRGQEKRKARLEAGLSRFGSLRLV